MEEWRRVVLHCFGCEWLSSLAPFPTDEVDFLGEKVDMLLMWWGSWFGRGSGGTTLQSEEGEISGPVLGQANEVKGYGSSQAVHVRVCTCAHGVRRAWCCSFRQSLMHASKW